MAQEQIHLVPTGDLTLTPFGYMIDFGGRMRRQGGVLYRFGHSASSGPVALKTADRVDVDGPRLRREMDVSEFLGKRGGELVAKCVAYEFTGETARILVGHRGLPLADLVADQGNWPPPDTIRRKMIIDLLQAMEILRLSGLVHGAISLRTLRWDGSTLQLTEFGTAAMRGRYPDGSPAHHGDDVRSAGRVIYLLLAGEPPPDDPVALRDQLENVQDARVSDLLLRRDLVTRAEIDYVFADDPAGRPTARTLINRMDSGPHGVQWEQLAAKEAETRADFRRLREAQRRARADLAAWTSSQEQPPPEPGPEAAAPWNVPPQPASPQAHPTGRRVLRNNDGAQRPYNVGTRPRAVPRQQPPGPAHRSPAGRPPPVPRRPAPPARPRADPPLFFALGAVAFVVVLVLVIGWLL